MALYVRLMVYMGLSLLIIRRAYMYLVVCILMHITLQFSRGMYTGSSFVRPSSISSLTIVTSPSSSSCSSFTGVVGVGVGIGVEVGLLSASVILGVVATPLFPPLNMSSRT